jgi:hypothetical protein
MTDPLHRDVAALLDKYRRELRDIEPGDDLDARISVLVAGARKKSSAPARRHSGGAKRWAAAAGVAALAITAGILIGMNLERGAPRTRFAQDVLPLSADFSLWPADSVALQIPAEYSAQGKLVAVDPHAQSTGKRYWIDVVVSNDGTIRIDRIVPAEGTDGITLQNP